MTQMDCLKLLQMKTTQLSKIYGLNIQPMLPPVDKIATNQPLENLSAMTIYHILFYDFLLFYMTDYDSL